MGEDKIIRRDPDLPGLMGGRWREPAMKPVEVVGARLDGEARCTDHALQGADLGLRELVGAGRLVWITEDRLDPEAQVSCAVCARTLGG
ncbi:MAG: hypothetical protein ACRDYC_08915 [Acidimicrobiales bacterium]